MLTNLSMKVQGEHIFQYGWIDHIQRFLVVNWQNECQDTLVQDDSIRWRSKLKNCRKRSRLMPERSFRQFFIFFCSFFVSLKYSIVSYNFQRTHSTSIVTLFCRNIRAIWYLKTDTSGRKNNFIWPRRNPLSSVWIEHWITGLFNKDSSAIFKASIAKLDCSKTYNQVIVNQQIFTLCRYALTYFKLGGSESHDDWAGFRLC